MIKKIVILTIPILLFVLMQACKKQQPQMTTEVTNPCDCANEVSAEFKMEEFGWSPKWLSETDTMYRGNNLLFTALDSTADCTWYIGAEVITERSFSRNFGVSLIGQTLPMHLVVKKEPNKICFPYDDGYDSITKYITIVDPGNPYVDTNYRIEGTYRMKDVNSADSVDIILDMDNSYVYPPTGVNWGPVYAFKNVDGQGLELPFRSQSTTYRQVWFESNGLGYTTECYIRFNSTPSDIEFVFDAHEYLGYTSYHYYGRKIN